MPTLGNQLILPTCPHCGVSKPVLHRMEKIFRTNTHNNSNPRCWAIYFCTTCGGVILCSSDQEHGGVREQFPKSESINDPNQPERARNFLTQEVRSMQT